MHPGGGGGAAVVPPRFSASALWQVAAAPGAEGGKAAWLKDDYPGALAQARVRRPNKYGKIINTASISGHIVNRPQDQTHYTPSKAGLIHLTKSIAAEWAADGIYVNSISPGYIRTEMADTPEIAKMHPIWLRDTPVGRLGEVEDLQGALIFLASDTSNFVTGCDLIVDGGFTIW